MRIRSIYMNGKMAMIFLLASIIYTGCTAEAVNTDIAVEKGSDTHMDYQIINAPYPSFIEEAVQAQKKKSGTKIVHQGKDTYVIISLGQRPSAGYSIQIKDVVETGGKVVVCFREKKPEGMAAAVLTYPSTVLKLQGTPKQVIVKQVK